jgi:hypothetical protein
VIEHILQRIERLPEDWHAHGSFGPQVLRAIVAHAEGRRILHSAETGTGKSTLLLSHLSRDHTTFTVNDAGPGGSLAAVLGSDLLNRAAFHLIEGPSQRTLPRFEFREPLQFALLDGPHGYPFPELEYYFIYPHLAPDALLVIDDIHIPTIFNLYRFLKEEPMFELLECVDNTAFFRRTTMPTADPLGDSWWLQPYNIRRFPISRSPVRRGWRELRRQVTRRVPPAIKDRLVAVIPDALLRRIL